MSVGRLVKVGTGESFPLGFEPVTIGRHPDSNIILDDQQVSRHHAEIGRQGGRWVIRDLGSANGTYVNEQPVADWQVLYPDDTIRLGRTTLRVELPIRISEQDTLVEKRPAPAAVTVAAMEPSPAVRANTPMLWVLLAAVVLVAVIAVGAVVLWPWLRGESKVVQPATGIPAGLPETAATATESDLLPTESLPTLQPTDTPILVVPLPEPSPTPTNPPPPTDTPVPAPVIGFFHADQTEIEEGQCTRLEWGEVERASVVTLTDVGRVNFSGRLDVCLDASKSYVLEARGMGGATTRRVQIDVRAPVGPIVEYFRAIPSILVSGDCALLEWGRVDNATAARIEPEIGGVGTPGSLEVCPDRTTTYTLTAENESKSVIAETTLIVSSGTDQKPVVSFFTANPSSIRAGECTLLDWGKVDYATSVEIDNGIGGVATPGSKEVCLGTTTTFAMSASGPGGTTDYALTVSVSPGQLADLPDLVIESILFEPNPCYRGLTCKVRVKVRNDGSVGAEGFIVRWAPGGVGDEAVPVEWDVDRLAAGEEKVLAYNWIPSRIHGSWRTAATVDVYDEVAEIEEGAANYLEQFVTVLEP